MSFLDSIANLITKTTGATSFVKKEIVQELWSGYGNIIRYHLHGSEYKSIIVKCVHPPKGANHPRGWNSDLGHQRKLKSYQVETNWYKDLSGSCDETCRIPKCLGVETSADDVMIVLEDLNDSGYPIRKTTLDIAGIEACIKWLAKFHSKYLNVAPVGLWEQGTYWHLATRPDELGVLKDVDLKEYASAIDEELNNSAFQTIVHGDAKLANFCFSPEGEVAAVDFQYVGGGCGMKDLAYFIGSCLHEDECEKYEQRLLDYYFKELKLALNNSAVNLAQLEEDWRRLYPYAWADFHRFLKGWSPGHWKINDYSERVTRQVIEELKGRIE